MIFQTQTNLPSPSERYSHANTFLCLGSCFATEIGNRLAYAFFDSASNPNGTLFNPLALSEILVRATENHPFEAHEFFEHQELWHHFLVHSTLASTDKQTALESANSSLQTLRHRLLKCDLLTLTLGSAWIYQKDGYDGSIGHNHRLPLSKFQRKRLTPDEISLSLGQAISLIKKGNPTLKTCVTVSPVRHLRDGLHENNLSKASLLLATDQLVTANEDLIYFPAYELLLDELRDYRFYADDLSHPSKLAADYIWTKFRDCFLDEKSHKTISETEEVLKMLSHRAHHTDTQQYASFKSSLKKKIRLLSEKLPQAKSLEARFDQLP